VSLQVRGPVSTRDFHSVAYFTQHGQGIALLSITYCDQWMARGELVRVLSGWASPQMPAHTLYPTQRFLPAELRQFLDQRHQW